ncbi:gliding motility lipoprotein GldB [Echinicola jeungdonensis]|uniref:Gliding motility lipoprotein GldB n=1 Tax=Echinicola jeungdonensis TaxID=709343 RepID=A0ABV5J778_9BACT|nr:gliding motility lipoprotein GldB [Echinicola jeungdonensis]MDN3669218.1 gliding motility lipoprotein GldB [Echinicola jeungdonensis]
MKLYFTLFCCLMLTLAACKKEEKACQISPEVQNIPLNLKIERLETGLFEAENEEEIGEFLESYPGFTQKYLQEDLYPSREALIQSLAKTKSDTLIQELYTETQNQFEDLEEIEKSLENAFKHISYYYPDFEVPKVYTFVSGFTSDLYLDQEMIVIGLDYFLPAEHRFQPPEIPRYIAERYTQEHLVPMIITALSARFIESNLKENTLLAEMIFYGKAYHFAKAMLPCTPERLIIGYSEKEVEACYANEAFIWTHLIENEAIYETNAFEIRKYTGEAPATDIISPDAPGRVGRWMGWNIVDDYRFNNDISLTELMKEKDSQKIFTQSGYKPRQ